MLAGPGATECPITIDCSIEQLKPWNYEWQITIDCSIEQLKPWN